MPVWLVREDYRIVDGYVDGSGGVKRSYHPHEHEELPFEIAKLADGDDRRIIRFVREWGLLGHEEVRRREIKSLPLEEQLLQEPLIGHGDPVDWIRMQANNLSLCISVVDGIVRSDEQMVAQATRNYFRALPSEREMWEVLLPRIAERRGDTRRGGTVADPIEEALERGALWFGRDLLQYMVEGHIAGIRPDFRFLMPDGQPFMTFDYGAMVEIAYFHVVRLAMGSGQIAYCEECGAPYKKTHGLQRFCPAGPFDSESRCSYKQRYRRFKSKEAT